MLRFAAIILMIALMAIATQARAASNAEVRDVAISYNCPPKKIEVYNQSVGTNSQTVYRVECALPKAKDESSKTASAILITCDLSLCAYTRAVMAEDTAQN